MSEVHPHQCVVCKLHYSDKKIAIECYAFCSANNACSIDIIKHSKEHKELMKKRGTKK